MRKFAALFVVFALAALSGAAACDHDKSATQAKAAPQGTDIRQVSLTGYLTDSYCGKANAKTEGKDCAAHCVKKGAKVQLLSEDRLYTLDKVEALESHLGVEVKVMGTLDEATNTIKVASVENLSRG